MSLKSIISIFLLIIFLRCDLLSSDFKVFGFSQMFYRNTVSVDENVTERFPGTLIGEQGNQTYGIQQLNLMGINNFGSGFSFFLNLSLTDNFDLGQQFGNISIQEIFVKWKNIDGTINLKFGSFLPQYNAFLEIINKFPAMPYIIRPFVYESNFYSYFNPDDFHPWKGNLQVYGDIPINKNMTFEYALYHANPELSFMSQAAGANTGGGGYNQSTNTLFGGRLGFSSHSNLGLFRIGGSIVFDEDNQEEATFGTFLEDNPVNLGLIRRNMIGADISAEFAGFTLTGEMMIINNYLSDEQTQQMSGLFNLFGLDKKDFEKMFFYGTLQYNIFELISIYATYSYLEDHSIPSMANGMTQLGTGFALPILSSIILKGQLNNLFFNDQSIIEDAPDQRLNGLEFQQTQLLVGVSVLF